ncbi:MAG: trypsin-like peptidase domain-containing protein [Chloroflexi bacterium]|nr:trypsin-like peptidase domain-containing protein [Chloroflexota bacterium]
MTEALQNLSNALAQTVATASPSIVRVEARRRLAASGIVWSADGLIVTAHHTVETEDNIQVGLPDGQTVAAALVGPEPSTDLAVLRSVAKNLSPLAPAAESAQVGHLVLALGRPGQTVQATLGIISALGNNWRTSIGGLIDQYVQTDVVMYPGFSGGPLVSAAGQLLGLNTSALMRGISLTVPTITLNRVAEMLVKHGKVRRGYLGVNTQPVRLPAALAQQLGQETGLLLVAVEPVGERS